MRAALVARCQVCSCYIARSYHSVSPFLRHTLTLPTSPPFAIRQYQFKSLPPRNMRLREEETRTDSCRKLRQQANGVIGRRHWEPRNHHNETVNHLNERLRYEEEQRRKLEEQQRKWEEEREK